LEVESEVNWNHRSNATKTRVGDLVATTLLCNETTMNHPRLRKYSRIVVGGRHSQIGNVETSIGRPFGKIDLERLENEGKANRN
jgi:hypothetical protein